jgi:hypothetical protein
MSDRHLQIGRLAHLDATRPARPFQLRKKERTPVTLGTLLPLLQHAFEHSPDLNRESTLERFGRLIADHGPLTADRVPATVDLSVSIQDIKGQAALRVRSPHVVYVRDSLIGFGDVEFYKEGWNEDGSPPWIKTYEAPHPNAAATAWFFASTPGLYLIDFLCLVYEPPPTEGIRSEFVLVTNDSDQPVVVEGPFQTNRETEPPYADVHVSKVVRADGGGWIWGHLSCTAAWNFEHCTLIPLGS